MHAPHFYIPWKRIFRSFLLLLVCLAGGLQTSARAQSTPLVFFRPDSLQIGTQSPGEVTIEVKDVEKTVWF